MDWRCQVTWSNKSRSWTKLCGWLLVNKHRCVSGAPAHASNVKLDKQGHLLPSADFCNSACVSNQICMITTLHKVFPPLTWRSRATFRGRPHYAELPKSPKSSNKPSCIECFGNTQISVCLCYAAHTWWCGVWRMGCWMEKQTDRPTENDKWLPCSLAPNTIN